MASPTSSNTDPVVEKFKTLLNSNVPGIGKAVETFIQLPFASEKERQETIEELSTFQPFYVVRLAQVFERILSSATTKPREVLEVIKICNETCLKAGLGSRMDFQMFTECLAMVFEAVKSDPLACTASISYSSLLKPLVNLYFSLQKANVVLPQTSVGVHFGVLTSDLVHPFKVVLQRLKPRLLTLNFHELVAETEAVIWCDGAIGKRKLGGCCDELAHSGRFRGNLLEKWLQLLVLPLTNDFVIFLARSDPIVHPAFLIDSLIKCSSAAGTSGEVSEMSLIAVMQKAMFELRNTGQVNRVSKPRLDVFFQHFSCLYRFPFASLNLLCNARLSNNDLASIMSLAPLLGDRKGGTYYGHSVREQDISLTDLLPRDFYPCWHGNYDVERCFLRMCGLVNSVPDIWPAFKEIFEFWRRSFYQTESAEKCFGILDAAVEVVAVIVQVIGREGAESNVQAFASWLNKLDIDAIQQIPAWSRILMKIITVFQHNWSALGVKEIVVKYCEHLPRGNPTYFRKILNAIFSVKECHSVNLQKELLRLAVEVYAEREDWAVLDGVNYTISRLYAVLPSSHMREFVSSVAQIPHWNQACFCKIAEKVRSSGCDVTAQAEILEQLVIAFRSPLKLSSKLKSRVYNGLLCCFDFPLSKASALTLLKSLIKASHSLKCYFFLPSIVYLYQTKVGGDVDSNVSCLDNVLTIFLSSRKVKLPLFVEFLGIFSAGTNLAADDLSSLLQILVATENSDDFESVDSLILLALKDARFCDFKPVLTTLCHGVKTLIQEEKAFFSRDRSPHSTSVELGNVDASSSSNGKDPLTLTDIHKKESFSPLIPLILNEMKANKTEYWGLKQWDHRNVEEKKHLLCLKLQKKTKDHGVQVLMKAFSYPGKQPIATYASCELVDDFVEYLREIGELQDDVEPDSKRLKMESDPERTENYLRPLSHLFGSIMALNGSVERKLCLSKKMTEALRKFDLEDREVVLLLLWHITWLLLSKKDNEKTEQDDSLAFLERILTIPRFLDVLRKTSVLLPAFDCHTGGTIPTMVSVASVTIGEGTSILSLENVLQVFQMMTEDVASEELTPAFLPLLSASLECSSSSEEVLHLLRQSKNLLRKVPQESMWFIVRCLVESYKSRMQDSDVDSLALEVSRAWRGDGCWSGDVGDVLQVPELLTQSFQSLSTEQERINLVSEVFKNLHDLKRDTVETVVACLSREQQHDRGLKWVVVQGKTETPLTPLTVSIKASLAFCMLSTNLTFTPVEELLRCFSHLQEHLSGASPNLAYFIVRCVSESCAEGLTEKDRDTLVKQVMKCWNEVISIDTLHHLNLPQLVVRIFLTTKVEEERRMLTSKLLKAVTTKRQTTTYHVSSTALSEDLWQLILDGKLSAVEIRVCLDVCLAAYTLCHYFFIPNISISDAIFIGTDVFMGVHGSKEVGRNLDLPLRIAGRITLSLKSALYSKPHSEKQLEEFGRSLSELLQLIFENSLRHSNVSCNCNGKNWGLELCGRLANFVEEFLIHTQDVESLIFWLRFPPCCLLKASKIAMRASQVSKNCFPLECGSNSKASFLKKVRRLLQQEPCKMSCVFQIFAHHPPREDLSELQVVLDAELCYDVIERLIDLAGDSLATAAACSKICATWPSQSECCALIEGMKMTPIKCSFCPQGRFLSGLLVPLGKVLTNSSEKVQLALERLSHMWYERQTCGLERLISWREQMIAANHEERVVNMWCTYFVSVENLKMRDVDVIVDLNPESMELILSGERSKRLFSEETVCLEEGGELYHEAFEMFLKLARLLSEFYWMVKQIDQSTKDAETLEIAKRGCDDMFNAFVNSFSCASTRGTVKKDLKTMYRSHHCILKELFVALFCRDSDNTSDLKNSKLLRQDKVFHSLLCLTRRWLSSVISKPTLANIVRRVVTLLLSHIPPRSSATIHQPEKSTESLHSVSTGLNSESYSYENQSHLVDIQDYILQIEGNQMAIARLQTSGYNRCQADGERTTNTVKNLWLDSSIELRGSLHTRRAMDDAELGSMLRNLRSEWKDILKHVGVDAVSIRDQEGKTVSVNDLFSDGENLAGMERQVMKVRRLLEGHVSDRVQEGRRRLDAQERELRQKFQRLQKAEDCETKTFVVVWENRFVENLGICSEKIPGCYSPTGWHSHKPVLCSLSVDNRIIVLFEERQVTSGSKPAREELENVEVKLLEAGMFVFDRHSCGHDIDTSELWSAFYKLLLESGAVPRIILSQKSPGYDFVTKFVRPEPIMDPVGFTFHETIVPANEDSYDFLPRVTFDSQQNRFVLSMTDDQSVFILLTKDNVKELVFKDLTEVDENNHLKLKKEQNKKNQKQRVKDVLRRVEKDLQQIHGEKTAKTLAQRLAGVVNRVISDQIEGTEESVVKEINLDKLSKGLTGLRDRAVYARVILNAVTNFTQSTSDA